MAIVGILATERIWWTRNVRHPLPYSWRHGCISFCMDICHQGIRLAEESTMGVWWITLVEASKDTGWNLCKLRQSNQFPSFLCCGSAENLIIVGADVSNAFAKAPPPKQGFYIHPDMAFRDWWVTHKKRPAIPASAVIPILSAMQGHLESPRLWGKHADTILRECGLVPTIHEPCLYSGFVDGKRVIFKCHVDIFAVAAPDKHTANVLLDMIDDKLTINLNF